MMNRRDGGIPPPVASEALELESAELVPVRSTAEIFGTLDEHRRGAWLERPESAGVNGTQAAHSGNACDLDGTAVVRRDLADTFSRSTNAGKT
jgi:hypothetical protein